ncbi:uncharacterized protein si:dkey-246e1.3 [Leucoraja erinacea]|uniref:uncharacterized protein si:dkey-246e1.3 n=1 Tax=Leucoraja erinaceus TaxID=7782 RepID=UPI002453EB60|nr:uncharacterized protein si:dkey-246e1.3 [Leucoraja erinacea]
MSLNTTDTLVGLVTNATDCGRNVEPGVLEFKIVNCILASVAICILIGSGIICSLSYIRRRRQLQQARLYENTIGNKADAVNIKSKKRTQSCCKSSVFMNKRKRHHNVNIFFISQNPMTSSEECIINL